jgi:hypothetical protein
MVLVVDMVQRDMGRIQDEDLAVPEFIGYIYERLVLKAIAENLTSPGFCYSSGR